jgi:hypothetical protein
MLSLRVRQLSSTAVATPNAISSVSSTPLKAVSASSSASQLSQSTDAERPYYFKRVVKSVFGLIPANMSILAAKDAAFNEVRLLSWLEMKMARATRHDTKIVMGYIGLTAGLAVAHSWVWLGVLPVWPVLWRSLPRNMTPLFSDISGERAFYQEQAPIKSHDALVMTRAIHELVNSQTSHQDGQNAWRSLNALLKADNTSISRGLIAIYQTMATIVRGGQVKLSLLTREERSAAFRALNQRQSLLSLISPRYQWARMARVADQRLIVAETMRRAEHLSLADAHELLHVNGGLPIKALDKFSIKELGDVVDSYTEMCRLCYATDDKDVGAAGMILSRGLVNAYLETKKV